MKKIKLLTLSIALSVAAFASADEQPEPVDPPEPAPSCSPYPECKLNQQNNATEPDDLLTYLLNLLKTE